jgi:hypothetical protein
MELKVPMSWVISSFFLGTGMRSRRFCEVIFAMLAAREEMGPVTVLMNIMPAAAKITA